MLSFKVKGLTEMVEIEGLTPAGLPSLRLLQYHSPQIILTCKRGSDFLKICLADIDLAPSFSPRDALNVDRAQLAKLGG